MKLTTIELSALMEVILDNLKDGGDGILVSDTEYQWMLTTLINNGERYEDCQILKDHKDLIVGDISSTFPDITSTSHLIRDAFDNWRKLND